jgi:predicted DNA-binding transcriptional regulator AlpA
MPARKPEPASQFDLFSARPEPPKRPVPAPPPPGPANDRQAPPARPKPVTVSNPLPPAADEWWTTRMTCAFLKISRKTLWERRKDKSLGFPQPVQLGGARNLYRASAIRSWAEAMAEQRN